MVEINRKVLGEVIVSLTEEDFRELITHGAAEDGDLIVAVSEEDWMKEIKDIEYNA